MELTRRSSTPLPPEIRQRVPSPCPKCDRGYKKFVDGIRKPISLKRVYVKGGKSLFYKGVISGHLTFENHKTFTDLERFDAYVNRIIAQSENM